MGKKGLGKEYGKKISSPGKVECESREIPREEESQGGEERRFYIGATIFKSGTRASESTFSAQSRLRLVEDVTVTERRRHTEEKGGAITGFFQTKEIHMLTARKPVNGFFQRWD